MKYSTEKELMVVAETATDKTFGEIDQGGRVNKRTKGVMGHVIEESLFGYDINSNSEADFEELGIELKVTPVKINKNRTISAKERLVLNIINYMTEVNKTFETSSFWTKNEKLLLFFYLWQQELEVKDYRILKTLLYTYPQDDLEIIKNDWKVIHNKIKEGKAHKISEGDTMYLGACTKGSSAKSLRSQPNSQIPAKQRAYSLKQSYMTTLVRQIFSTEELTSLVDSDQLKKKSFEEILKEKFEPYYDKTIDEIAEMLGIDINIQFKSRVQQIVSAILGIRGTKLSDIEEFSKANIQFKTVRLEPNGIPREHMSFEQINFDDWLSKPFVESIIYEKFETTKFLFVVFQYKERLTPKNKNTRRLYLKGMKLWNMPEETIQIEIYDLWKTVKEILEEGVQLNRVKWGSGYRVENNLPSMKFNGIVHIRPKAKDGSDKVKLPDGQYITKQTYWLNREYVAEIVNDI